MHDEDVIVVGAGPVGLWLAFELRLAGARVTILEKRAERSVHSRALTVHARTLEVFAMRGVAGGWLDEGVKIPTTHFAMLPSRVDLSELDTDYPFALFIPQLRTEELLEALARDAGVRLLQGVEVRGIEVTEDGVRVRARGPHREVELRSKYVVGCDGRRSVVREESGIGYTGTEGSLTCVLGDVRVREPGLGPAITKHTDQGSFYAVRMNDDRYRLVGIDPTPSATPAKEPLGLDEFRSIIQRLTGADFGMHDPSWLTRVGAATYQADQYRKGRIFLAGDAAHVHFPMGGQGLNLGIQDAMNLGWKLGAVLRSAAAPSLLDSYEAERLPIGKNVINDTLAQTAIVTATGREGRALRDMMTAFLAENRALNGQLALAISGLGVAYPPAHGNREGLIGHRIPNLPLTDGSHTYPLLHGGRFVAVGIPEDVLVARLGSAASRLVTITPAEFHTGPLGPALIRPDGHLAWSAPRGSPASHGSEEARACAGDLVDALLRCLEP